MQDFGDVERCLALRINTSLERVHFSKTPLYNLRRARFSGAMRARLRRLGFILTHFERFERPERLNYSDFVDKINDVVESFLSLTSILKLGNLGYINASARYDRI